MSPSKLFSVRVPSHELEAFEAVCGSFPRVSPALIMRSLVLTGGKIAISNALAKHAVAKVKGDPR